MQKHLQKKQNAQNVKEKRMGKVQYSKSSIIEACVLSEQTVSCPNCLAIQLKFHEIKSSVGALQAQKESLQDEIELYLANFSYIVELVAKNIQERFDDFVKKIQDNQKKLLKNQQKQESLHSLNLIAAQRNEISELKKKIEQLVQENSCYQSEAKKTGNTRSSQSSLPHVRSEGELHLEPNIKNNKKQENPAIQRIFEERDKKLESIEQLRGRLQHIRHRIAKIF